MRRNAPPLVAVLITFAALVFTASPDRAMAADANPTAPLRISVTAGDKTVVFELNASGAARDLARQLPLTLKVEDYGGIEKIFYPPKKLSTDDTPLATDNPPGSLAYYAPWGDVAMFYGHFGSAAGLYALGRALEGGGEISGLSGTISIEEAVGH
jgi:hypothetical protein